ncbi:MAG: lipopolysaccharide assembly protein LapA domain-containing protein, partial [Nitrospinaceae bacterium]
MSFKIIIAFAFLLLLAVYFAFLNPEPVQVHLTQSFGFEMPLIVFLLSSLLTGVLLTMSLQSVVEMRASWRRFRETLQGRKLESRFRKVEKWFRKAENAMASGRESKGVGLLEKVLAEQPLHLGALFHLGNHYRQKGDPGRAVELHLKAVSAYPEDIKTWHSLGEDYAQSGDFQKQVETLQRCLELDPHSLPTLRKLRDACLRSNLRERAYTVQKSILPLIHEPEELAKEQDLFAQVIYSVGLAHLQDGRVDQAIAEFRRSIRENPRSLPSYVTLGDLYTEVNNTRQAVKIWKTGYAMTRSPVCLLRIESMYGDLEKPEAINKLYRDALSDSENSEREELALLYVDRLLAQGGKEEAVQVLEKLDNASLPIQLLTAKAYRETNLEERADAAMQAAFER